MLFIQIEKHRLTIVATDSNQIKPITVDTLIYTSGERYEFVLEANQSIGKFKAMNLTKNQIKSIETSFCFMYPGTYWIRLSAIGPCEPLKLEQFALLTYMSPSVLSDTDLAFTNNLPPAFDEKYPDGVVSSLSLN